MASDIRFEDVTRSYGGTVALEDVTLHIERGITTAVVGPSGGGKSTLLQLVNGLERPDRGRVLIDGQPIDYDRLPALRRRMGYAVQGTGLFPHLTVFRNITLVARLCGWEPGRIEKRAEELMRLVDLPASFADRYPHELSGGEQQRVGLCRAMMLDPDLMLLDEPFGALDPITRAEIHGEFQKLQRAKPRTVVLVTHDLREAFLLARNVVILHGGRVVQAAPCTSVREQPANAFVRDLLRAQLSEPSATGAAPG